MKTAPYGSWASPITTDVITKAAPGLDQPLLDGDNLYWLQSRPWEKGRSVVMRRRADGTVEDVLPAPLSAHSRANEYGGAPYLVVDDVLYFCLDHDQRIYQLDLAKSGAVPEALTPEGTPEDQCRYSDFCIDNSNQRLIAVCEAHTSGEQHPKHSLVAVPLDGSQQLTELTSGNDFYSNPRISPDGTQLSWLCWNHPQMPWDGTELWCANLATNGELQSSKKLAGGDNESIFQPQWSPDGSLYFVSDRSNWWNIYRLNSDGSATAIYEMDAEFATPQWVFGMSTYGFLDADTIACCYTQNGLWQFATIDLSNNQLTTHESPYSEISSLQCHAGRAVFIGASSLSAPELVEFTGTSIAPLYQSEPLPFDRDYLSQPNPISFPTGGGEVAHALFYQPANKEYCGPDGDKPPLIVMCHGGPTASASAALNFKAQFWASRGFAVLDVNYRGSTGFGRAYRDSLKGEWGIKDVDDTCYGVRYLAEQGLIDGDRAAIRGGSAGGYTVLAALTFHDTFKAGASLYGIGDLELIASDTHKFEARYLDSLIGPYPETKQTYIERSPIHSIDQLTCPVIFLQGLDDKVVPPEQADLMVAALKEKQIPVAHVTFAGEGHGFRQAENIKTAYESELYFYAKVFGFEPAEPLPGIEIANLEAC